MSAGKAPGRGDIRVRLAPMFLIPLMHVRPLGVFPCMLLHPIFSVMGFLTISVFLERCRDGSVNQIAFGSVRE